MKKFSFIFITFILTLFFSFSVLADEGGEDDQKYDGSSLNEDQIMEIMENTADDGKLVICIDPGHGGVDSGSNLYGGGKEKINNLKIAGFLREELEEYEGVTVVMTRVDDVDMSLADRALFAAQNNADILISIHTDAASTDQWRGISVFYPNDHLSPDLCDQGFALAVNVSEELTALGLSTFSGVTTRTFSADSDDLSYPEGLQEYSYPATEDDIARGVPVYTSPLIEGYTYTTADYYSIIRNAKRLGIPAVIVEHGFGNNKEDFEQFMSTDEKLKELALADARALATTYNLRKYDIEKGSDGKWYCMRDGAVLKDTFIANGTAYDIDGRWYVKDGMIQRDYSGLITINGTVWVIKNGLVDNSVTDILPDEEGNWWYIKDGQTYTSYTGIAPNENGWWRIVNGKVDFDCNTVELNEYGWWYCIGGKVQFDYTGIAPNENGWWRIEDGHVNFDFTGLAQNGYGWFYLENGKVNFDYTGITPNEYGWWRVENGMVNFNCYSVEYNEYGWWYLEGGRVNFDYTGIAPNVNGWWRIENGGVNFGFNGLAQNENGWWYLEGGKVNFDYYGTYEGYTIIGGKVQF